MTPKRSGVLGSGGFDSPEAPPRQGVLAQRLAGFAEAKAIRTRSQIATEVRQRTAPARTEAPPKPAAPKGFRRRPIPFAVELARGVAAFDARIANRPNLTRPPRSSTVAPDPDNQRDRSREALTSTQRGTNASTRSLHPHRLFDYSPRDDE